MIKTSKKMVLFTIISTLRDVSCLPAGRGIAENPSSIIWSGDNRGKAKVARSSGAPDNDRPDNDDKEKRRNPTSILESGSAFCYL
jgi:hypothetical protein